MEPEERMLSALMTQALCELVDFAGGNVAEMRRAHAYLAPITTATLALRVLISQAVRAVFLY